MAMGAAADDALANRTAGIEPRHVAGSSEFIEKDKLIQRYVAEAFEPDGPRRLHVGTLLLGGVEGLFFKG